MHVDLILNLSLLVALSVVSGFVVQRRPGHTLAGALAQGGLFGTAALIGMLRPVVYGPGLFLDGRSVMISVCALFFGPRAALVAAAIPMAYRLWLGGGGVHMGVLVILASAAIGIAGHAWRRPTENHPSARDLWLFGMLVHLAMLASTAALSEGTRWATLRSISPPILLLYPLATILAGKILSDQQRTLRLVDSLQVTNKNLDVTLRSIGDAVVTTDLEGRVVRMNPVAERLTGWTVEAAAGRALEEVFVIVNEDTGENVPSPVRKVLARGEVVDLANHTVLVARDGVRRPIADSAAPIRHESGVVSGVVLVFSDQTTQHAVRKALRASEARYRTLFTDSNATMLLIDPADGRIVDANAAAADYYGWPVEQLLTMRMTEINTLPLDQIRAAMEHARARKARHFDFRHRLASGEVRDVEVYSGPVRIGHRDMLLSIVQDVTARRRTEAALRESLREKDALLREVHHRVKNNLQVVSSLLRLEASRSGHPATVGVLSEMQGRIRSMALLHETLYRSGNLAEVDLSAYLQTLNTQLSRLLAPKAGSIRLQTTATSARVAIDQAVPCGLIVNELVSNAFKHAFPGGRAGEVRVSLEEVSPVPTGADGTSGSLANPRRLRLAVIDDGVGLPVDLDLAALRSLGLHLVSDLVRQLGGALEIRPGPGAAFTVVFTATAPDTP